MSQHPDKSRRQGAATEVPLATIRSCEAVLRSPPLLLLVLKDDKVRPARLPCRCAWCRPGPVLCCVSARTTRTAMLVL
jgi:hypothetical protein